MWRKIEEKLICFAANEGKNQRITGIFVLTAEKL